MEVRELRKDWISKMLDEYDGQRLQLTTEARAKKYQKMVQSPYTFYRGSAYAFYQDLLNEPLYQTYQELKPTWVQGDLHFENFGTFHNARGEIVYDVNDFDEAYLGSYILDIARMSVSLVLVGRELQFAEETIAQAVKRYLKAYEKQIRRFANREEDLIGYRFTAHTAKGPIGKLLRKLAEKRSRETLFERFMESGEDGWQLRRDEELEDVDPTTYQQIIACWDQYVQSIPTEQRMLKGHYAIKDIAHKRNSGTGSLGLDRFYLLVEGEADDQTQDDILLEMKEARYSVLDAILPTHDQFHELFEHPGKQVITSQRAMQHEPDPFLGIISIGEKQYYVRERSPYKAKLALKRIKDEDDFLATVKMMGKLTAKIHARADFDSDQMLFDYHSEVVISESIQKDRKAWRKSVTEFAFRYAEQVKQDYSLFEQIVNEKATSV